MTKLRNPGPGGKYATIEGVTYGTDEPGGEIETTSALHATILVEYGFVMDPTEYAAALDAAAERQRAENSAVSSASASEGKILGRQATVDVESGAVTTPPEDPAHPDDPTPEELKGDALKAAAEARGISSSLSADEKRAAVAEYDAALVSGEFKVGDDGQLERGEDGSYVRVDPGDGFVRDDAGELVLDDDGNPVPIEREIVDAGDTPGERAADAPNSPNAGSSSS